MKEPIKIYAFCNSGNGTDWQNWYAMCEDGRVITSHCSSSRGWGIHDVTDVDWKRDHYEREFGAGVTAEDFEFIVCDDGDVPPAHVIEANRALAAVDEANEARS